MTDVTVIGESLSRLVDLRPLAAAPLAVAAAVLYRYMPGFGNRIALATMGAVCCAALLGRGAGRVRSCFHRRVCLLEDPRLFSGDCRWPPSTLVQRARRHRSAVRPVSFRQVLDGSGYSRPSDWGYPHVGTRHVDRASPRHSSVGGRSRASCPNQMADIRHVVPSAVHLDRTASSVLRVHRAGRRTGPAGRVTIVGPARGSCAANFGRDLAGRAGPCVPYPGPKSSMVVEGTFYVSLRALELLPPSRWTLSDHGVGSGALWHSPSSELRSPVRANESFGILG